LLRSIDDEVVKIIM